MDVEPSRLKLVPQTLEQVRTMIAALSPADRAEVSADWLAKLDAATSADPWLHGFSVVDGTGDEVGHAGFKGPPDAAGVVEIAYGISQDHQGRGYGTEAAAALTAYALASGRVRIVRAHTLPQPNASTRVLTKNGFQFIGEVTDPEDGQVWRWEQVIAE